MSGILLPLIKPTAAALTGGPVNTDEILTVSKQTINNPTGAAASAAFSIIFSMKAGSVPQIITWTYVDQSALDTEFALVENTIAAVVA